MSEQPPSDQPMSEQDRTYTKTTQDGRPVTITLDDDMVWQVHLDGRPYTRGRMHRLPPARRPATHGIGGGTGNVLGLLPHEAAALEEIYARARAAQPDTPDDIHRRLTAEVEAATFAWQAARERASNEGDWSGIAPAEERMKSAEEALTAFYTEHPDIHATVLQERQERARRAIDAAFRD